MLLHPLRVLNGVQGFQANDRPWSPFIFVNLQINTYMHTLLSPTQVQQTIIKLTVH